MTIPLIDIYPDLDAAEEFIELLTGNESSSYRTFSDNENKIRPTNTYGKFNRLSKSLVSENRRGSGVFVVINKTNGGNSDKDVQEIRALFVDLDGAPLEPVLSSPCEPHLVVETSPGKYHCYWLTTGGFPVTEFAKYQKALARKFSGDASVHNPSRVMRIPGFYHNKNPKEPYLTRIIGKNSLMPYDPADLALMLRLDFSGLETTGHLALVKPRSSIGVIPNGMRDDQLFRRGCILRNAGMNYEEIYEILCKKNLELCEEPLRDWQIQKIARSAARLDAVVDDSLAIKPKTVETIGVRHDVEKKKRPAFMDMMKTFCQLEQMVIPPLKWVVPEVLPQGLVLLAGAPKMGKSLVVQQLSYAVALGGIALGKFPTIQGDVLHLALEDSDSRFKERMEAQKKLMHDGPAPTSAHFLTQWSMMPKAVDDIRAWCEYVDNPKLVVIDTLGRILQDGGEGGNVYRADYQIMAKFHSIAKDYGVAVVLVHHLRKMDSSDPMMQVSGSVGLTGAADLVWVFQRKTRTMMEAKIQSMGKDLGDTTYNLEFDSEHLSWLCRDFASDDSVNVIQFMVKEFFVKFPNKKVTASELADHLRKSKQYVNRVLRDFAKSGLLLCSQQRGGWVYTINPDGLQ